VRIGLPADLVLNGFVRTIDGPEAGLDSGTDSQEDKTNVNTNNV